MRTKSKLWALAAVAAVGIATTDAYAGRVDRMPPARIQTAAAACACPKLVMLTVPVSESELEIWYVVSDKVESVNPGTQPDRSIVRTVSGLQREVQGDVATVAGALGIEVN